MRRSAIASVPLALLTTCAVVGLAGCSINDSRGDEVTWDGSRSDRVPDPMTEQPYRDAQYREMQRQKTVVSAKSTVRPKR